MLRLVLPYPISANRYWASRVIEMHGRSMPVVYVTADAKTYRAKVWDACLAYGVNQVLAGRVEIGIQLYPQRPQDFKTRMRKHGQAWDDDVRCIDLDNANKVLLDALKGVAFEDDKWVRSLQSERMEPDEHGARVVVYIRQLQLPVVQQSLLEEAQ